MTRKEGFIEVDKMLEEIGVNVASFYTISCSPLVNVIKDNFNSIHFSFSYEGETYFYKRNSYLKNGSPFLISPYNELVAEELAKDFDIPCIDYDLAVINSSKGVLSKNFKEKNVTYISGYDLFIDARKNTRTNNTLDGIWDILECRYYDYTNKREIISHLMKKIVDIYLFDIISCHCDRHSKNWKIVEEDSNIDIAPLYDNERILACCGEEANIAIGINNDSYIDYENLWESIQNFQKISNEEFTNIIKDKLWIIGEKNLCKIFEKLENKTEYPMPVEEKKVYVRNYQEHKRRLEKILVK